MAEEKKDFNFLSDLLEVGQRMREENPEAVAALDYMATLDDNISSDLSIIQRIVTYNKNALSLRQPEISSEKITERIELIKENIGEMHSTMKEYKDKREALDGKKFKAFLTTYEIRVQRLRSCLPKEYREEFENTLRALD